MSLIEPMTSAASTSSLLLSSIYFPIMFCCMTLVLPASSSINLNASTIYLRDSVRSSAMVISAMRPDYRQSWSMNVVPILRSRSNETDLRRHMWKNVLYWMRLSPSCLKCFTYMKLRCSV